MADQDPSGAVFETATATRAYTTAQLGTALFILVTAAVVLVNLAWIGFAADKFDPLMFIVNGVVLLAGGAWFFRWLRRAQHYVLTVSARGVAVSRAGVERSWGWAEIRALAVASHAWGRTLVIEDERCKLAEDRLPRSTKFVRISTFRSPLAVSVPLQHLTADEITVVDAIRRFSDGRFPDAERRGVPGVRST